MSSIYLILARREVRIFIVACLALAWLLFLTVASAAPVFPSETRTMSTVTTERDGDKTLTVRVAVSGPITDKGVREVILSYLFAYGQMLRAAEGPGGVFVSAVVLHVFAESTHFGMLTPRASPLWIGTGWLTADGIATRINTDKLSYEL